MGGLVVNGLNLTPFFPRYIVFAIVTISNFNWQTVVSHCNYPYQKLVNDHNIYTPDFSTAICMLLTPPKRELNSLRRYKGLRFATKWLDNENPAS
jgi:hypothetical protein